MKECEKEKRTEATKTNRSKRFLARMVLKKNHQKIKRKKKIVNITRVNEEDKRDVRVMNVKKE